MRNKRTYGFAWSVMGLVTAVSLGYIYRTELRAAILPAPAAVPAALEKTGAGADWFLLVRVPEITAQRESGVGTMKVRLGEWLDALSKAGFHPMRLSEILFRLERGEPLPQRAVAFFFNPAYRRTYEIVSPIFGAHNCPAALLTNKEALNMSDRRYINAHSLRDIRLHHGWDSGFSDNTGSFSVEGLSGRKTGRWSAAAGALALNRWRPGAPVNFLTSNADWLSDELVNRLLAETPVSGKMGLTKATVHGRDWGVISDKKEDSFAFNMQAQASSRGAKLFWLGTQGQNDFRLTAKARSLFGELWLQLRYDEASGDNIHIILSGRSMVIEEERENKVRRLALLPQARSFSEGPFSVETAMQGGMLSVSVDGGEPKVISGLSPIPYGKGVVQVYLRDKMRGTSNVQGLRLLFKPLEGGPARSKRSAA